MLKNFEVYRPKLDENNNIIGHDLLNKAKYPELSINKIPNDFDFEYFDKHRNPRYRWENNQPVTNNPTPTTEQLTEEKAKKANAVWYKIIKGIYKGEINSFADIKSEIINLIDGS